MRILRKILNKAVLWEYIDKNPLKSKLPPVPKGKHPVLTLQQLFDLVNNLSGKDKYTVILTGFVGLRRLESLILGVVNATA